MAGRIVLENLFGPETDFDAMAWESFRPGIDVIKIYGVPTVGPSAALLRYAPGASLPPHRHCGYEHILVLRSTQQDEHGVMNSGSLTVNSPGSSHTVRSAEGCVVLVIWEKPIEISE